MLDTSSLEKAIANLKKVLKRTEANLKDEELRDAAIQRFEYTYELCVKMIKRKLEQIELPDEIERMTYKDLVRTGAEKGLLDEPELWFKYRDNKNITSHTYDESKADKVYSIIPSFVKSADNLLKCL